MTTSGASGLLIQYANGQVPSDNEVIGFEANNVPGYALFIVGANYTNVNGIAATVCGTGVQVSQSSGGFGGFDNTVNGIKARAGTNGVVVTTGCSNTLLTGRSTGNTANLTTTGSTNTISTNLVLV